MQTRSASVYPQPSPTKKPLLSRLWWVSVAPLGKPVVPEVYWMLIGSSAESCVSRSARSARSPARPRPAPRPARLQQPVPLGVAEEQPLAQLREVAAHRSPHRPVVARLEL